MCAVKSQIPQVIDNLSTEHVNGKWGFCNRKWDFCNRKCFLQPEVGFLHPWAVVLPKYSANRLYKTKDTWQHNFGSVRHDKWEKVSFPVDTRR